MLNLTFHGLGEPGRELEPGEQRVWISVPCFQSILDDAVGRRDVHLTFDDGNASDVTIALPELRRRNLQASFFLLGGKLGLPGYLDLQGVRELSQNGMRIGTHGMHHRDWSTLRDEELTAEIADSTRILQETTGGPVEIASCPFGSYDRRVLRMLRGAGFRVIYTSDRGWARADGWLQPRNTIHDTEALQLADLGLNHGIPGAPGLLKKVWRLYKRWR